MADKRPKLEKIVSKRQVEILMGKACPVSLSFLVSFKEKMTRKRQDLSRGKSSLGVC